MTVALAAILVRLDANTVEIFRSKFHKRVIMTERGSYRNTALDIDSKHKDN
jgi:hypothetical protein